MKSEHTLKIKEGSTTYTCDLYTSQEEARSVLYPNNPILCIEMPDYSMLYAAFTPTLDSAAESTPLLTTKNGTNYCVAQKSYFPIDITTVANATIKVDVYNVSFIDRTTQSPVQSFTSGTKWFPYGYSFEASVTSATGYKDTDIKSNVKAGAPWAGDIAEAGDPYLYANSRIQITATAPALKTYTLKVGSPAHQTVTVKYKNRNAANTGYETEKTLAEGGSASVRHFTTWTATVSADTGWTAGALTPASSGTVSGGVTVSAGAATYKTFTLKCASTAHQTITLKYKNKKSDGTFDTEKPLAEGDSKTVGYGTTWTATLAADAGYTKGTLSGTKGTVTANTTVSATAATAITPKITFTWTADGWTPTATITYTNTSGSSATATKPSSVTIKYNTTIKITDTKNSYRYYLKITQGSTYKTAIHSKESWTSGALTANTTFKIVGYYDEYEGSSGEGSGGEGGGGE